MATAEFTTNERGNEVLRFTSFCKVVIGNRTNYTSIADGYDLFLSLQKAYREKFPCPICEGEGYTPNWDDLLDEYCIHCNGTGIKMPVKEDG